MNMGDHSSCSPCLFQDPVQCSSHQAHSAHLYPKTWIKCVRIIKNPKCLIIRFNHWTYDKFWASQAIHESSVGDEAEVKERRHCMMTKTNKQWLCKCFKSYVWIGSELSTHVQLALLSMNKPIHILSLMNEVMNFCVNKNRNKCDYSHSVS